MTLFVSVARGPRMRLMGNGFVDPPIRDSFHCPRRPLSLEILALVRDRAIPSAKLKMR